MAFGAITLIQDAGAQPSAPLFADAVSLVGDGAYPTGGTPGFRAYFDTVTKDGRTPIAVIPQLGDGDYYPVYDVANDKLVVYRISTNAEAANAANLSGITFKFVVLSQ